MDNPNYYAIIPAHVRYSKELKANEKLLFGEITSLTHSNGKCWANNQYFAELYGVSKTSISKWIKNLIENGFLKSELEYKEGSKEILNRYLTIVQHPIEEKLKGGVEEKLKDNNTSINNTSIIDYTRLLDFLNKKTGRSFRVINKSVKNKFIARLKDGYTKQDIINAISNAVNSQYHKESNYQYLTPEFFSRSTTLDKYGSTSTKENDSKSNMEAIDKGEFTNF